MRKLLLLTLVYMLLPSSAIAGWVIKEAVRDGGQQYFQTVFLQKGHVKVDEPNATTFAVLKSGQVSIADHSRRVRWSGSLQELTNRSGMGADEGRQMDSYGGYDGGLSVQDWGQDYQTEGEYGDYGGDETSFDMTINLRKTGEQATIAGFSTQKSQLLMEGEVMAEVWISTAVGAFREVNMGKYAEFQAASGQLIWLMYEDSPDLQSALRSGFPIKTVIPSFDGEGPFVVEAVSVENRNISANELTVPNDYRSVSLAELLEQEVISRGSEDMESRGGNAGGQRDAESQYNTEGQYDTESQYGTESGYDAESSYDGESSSRQNAAGQTQRPPARPGVQPGTDPNRGLAPGAGSTGNTYTDPDLIFTLQVPNGWRAQESGDTQYLVDPQTQSAIVMTLEHFPRREKIVQDLPNAASLVINGARPSGPAQTLNQGGRQGVYQDFAGTAQGNPLKMRIFASLDEYVAVILLAYGYTQNFGALEQVANAAFQTIRVPTVDLARTQTYQGRWVGVRKQKGVNYGGGVSTEHILLLRSDGTCESSDFVAVSGSTGDSSPMAGYDQHSVSGTATGSYMETGRYFVAGNVLYVVSPDKTYYAYYCGEPGVLEGENLRYIRQ